MPSERMAPSLTLDDDHYCSQCEDTGWIPCGHCDGGEADPFCGDDLCFGGHCITGRCSPRECRTCSGDGGWECNCEEDRARAITPEGGEHDGP